MVKAGNYLKHVDSLIAAIIGYVVIWLFTKYDGIGISPDSIMYISAARHFHDHGSLITFNNKPIVDFPVFYPVFLAFTYFISTVDPLQAGPVIDGLLFASVIFISGVLMQKFAPKSLLYKWLVLAAIILSQALLQVFTYMWSETLFILIILIFFIAFSRYLNTRTYKALIIAAIVAGISCITRYAGVTLIGTGGLLLLIDEAFPFKKRWGRIFTFGFIAIAFLIINLIRNALVTGTTTGPREKSITGFFENLSYFGTVTGFWATATINSYAIAVIVGALIILALIAALLYHTFKKNLNNYLALAIAFALVYGLFIVLSSTFSRYERINNRLLAPMYIPLIWALTWWIVHLPKRWSAFVKVPVYIATALIALFIEYRLVEIDYQRYDDQFDYGNPGYTDDTWKESEIVTWMRKHPEFFKTSAPIYADAYEAVYFFTEHTNVKLLPHLYFEKDIQQFYNQKHFYLIWIKGLGNPELIDIKDIKQHLNLKKLEQFEDGEIYEYDATENK